ncbi:helix-turn-helix domain-containing protein [Deinococcus sp. SM5_A1]|uniref:helix-turn-helix domain-containing protein n=1 Tax=Deinococcus sp. SM5_A1 TaxID=3379094 RepID=UPI00385FDF66
MTEPRTRSRPRDLPTWAVALRVRRIQLGLSQEGVAAASNDGISQKAVSDLETGNVALNNLALGRVVALARALGWSLSEMQRATGIDLGMVEATLVGEGSADVYPLSAALSPANPGLAVDHEMVTPGVSRPLLLRADTDEMQGTSQASIRPGSSLHVDLDRTDLQEGLVYVIADGEGVHVRLYTTTRLGAGFRAENRVYEDIPASEAQVIGQVMAVTTDYSPDLN